MELLDKRLEARQAGRECSLEMLFLVPNDPMNPFPLLGEVRIVLGEHFDHDISEAFQEKPLDSKQPPMAHCTAQHAPEHVTSPLVARENTVTDQERHTAGMIGDHPK
ncbi:hypothetical protein HRbin27_00494 [bacterium HR27]|nr:hypothetical protein HRbin27_00494 [bacterium HR27]